MRLWLLRPIETPGDNPWEPWYDKAFGFVVRASSEEAARALAHDEAGDENCELRTNPLGVVRRSPWLDPHYSTCVPLEGEGPAEIVLRDFAAA